MRLCFSRPQFPLAAPLESPDSPPHITAMRRRFQLPLIGPSSPQEHCPAPALRFGCWSTLEPMTKRI